MIRAFFERTCRLISLIVQWVFVALASVALVIFWQWIPLKNLIFRQSLNGHAQTIRLSSCTLSSKKHLLDCLDDLKQNLSEGETTSLLRWAEFDEALESLLKDGITSDDERLIEREFDQMERELRANP